MQSIVDLVPASGQVPYSEFLNDVNSAGLRYLYAAKFHTIRRGPLELVGLRDEAGSYQLVVQRRAEGGEA